MGEGLKSLGGMPKRVRMEALEAKVEAMGKALSKETSLKQKNARLTTKEVAQLLRCHPKTVERWTRKRGLPCKRSGRNLVFL